MSESSEDEIYSTMFSSLKHPVRRKILRMLANKPMTFMEMVDELGVSSSHLTYHLESLGELVSKLDSGQYKLSTFGVATVGAMKGVEDVRDAEPKRRQVTSKWKTVSAVLLIVVILISALSVVQYVFINQLSTDKQLLSDQNDRLLSYGMDANKVANFLENVTKLDVSNYTLTLGHDAITTTFGTVVEESIQYAARSSYSNLNLDLRFRNNHFNNYLMTMVESSPIFTQVQPNDVLQNAKYTLARYKAYSGDVYLTNMSNIINSIGTLNQTEVIQGNIKLKIEISLGTVTFTWSHIENGVDFYPKGLQMVFQNNFLTRMTDGYYLFTVGNTKISTSEEQAINIAKDYVKTMTYQISGQTVSGFSTVESPLKVDFAPHPRDSIALYPYWYVEMKLTETYDGGINLVTVGVWGDTGQIADWQMLSSGT
jgi:DNA-binding transcriptional ArsR family regulator